MDRELLTACTKGDLSLCNHLILITNPDILLSITPFLNSCLHIAAMLGHEEFAKEVWSRAPSLLFGTNIDGETPLIAALMAANDLLASDIITAASQYYMQHDDLELGRPLNRMLLKFDRRGENALHHAMRNGFEKLALQLLDIEPRLSEKVINTGESPMYMAARREYSRVVERLIQIPSSAYSGPYGSAQSGHSRVVQPLLQIIPSSADSGPKNESALHAAVRFGHKGIAKQLLEGRSQLAYCKDAFGNDLLLRAIVENNLELVKIFLEYDHNLAYTKHEPTELTPFNLAAQRGFLSIAEETMSTCPDSVYTPNINGNSALIQAILSEKADLIDYILRTPQLHRLMNQADNDGSLPLHHAARKCDPKLLRSLLTHAGQDYTAVNVYSDHALDVVNKHTTLWKTLKWNESFTLLSNVIPVGWKNYARDNIKQTNKRQAMEKIKSLTEKYTSNTSLVAALLATITFAAAFTLPGGFGTDPG